LATGRREDGDGKGRLRKADNRQAEADIYIT
jgi:hypothetical protein